MAGSYFRHANYPLYRRSGGHHYHYPIVEFGVAPLWLMRSRNRDSNREKHLKTLVNPTFLELISFAKAIFLTLTIRLINAMVRAK